ncbi:hypothetical protein F7725_003952 [Dissostichus mawsoni]|uniref:Uncharacterized protein n=1 Tax=Dissostichus mawsoni TaxID=36200 RepID=A0A7J5YBQ3_DISMA|nr:hypothetical protein F7725_003952 [Dissostichus mawsoni]
MRPVGDRTPHYQPLQPWFRLQYQPLQPWFRLQYQPLQPWFRLQYQPLQPWFRLQYQPLQPWFRLRTSPSSYECMETLGLTVVGRPLISMIQDYTPPAKTRSSTQPPPPPTPQPPHFQHHLPGRPVFYVHAPPPPPFHPCQWPMPFSYNPFAGFQEWVKAKGWVQLWYGDAPGPSSQPYMEVPAYVMPRPDMQPVDYRRFIHPQAPSVAYQNPYQPCRVRPHHTDPVRETVNSEVQTEPQQRGRGFSEESPLSADSGSGTAINSPSSSSSSSQKQNSAEVENDALHSSNAKDLPVKETRTTAIQSSIRATLDTRKSRKESVGQENVPPCRNARCNTWSVGSQDGMDPVCSSSQIPVPDILMSWGGGTPQETMLKIADKLLQNDLQTEVEQDKSVHQSRVETRISPEAAYPKDDAGNLISERSEVFFKQEAEEEQQYAESRNNEEYLGLVGSVRHCLRYADKLLQSSSNELPDNEQEYSIETNLLEDTAPIIPSINNSSYLKRTWNESIWSVESLAPFIPTEEWLQHVRKKAESTKWSGHRGGRWSTWERRSWSAWKRAAGRPMADQKTAEVSPSKVDFGVQCNEFQEHRCACEERRCSMGLNRNQPFTYSENKNGNYRQGEGPIMRGQTQKNQRKQGYRKPRGQGKTAASMKPTVDTMANLGNTKAQAPSVAYQNPYQPCRVRPHHTDPVRETVNSEVQTEPQQRGGGFSEESLLISADSGLV